MYDDDSDNDHALCWREEPPYRRWGTETLDDSGETVRCESCGRVDSATLRHEWDDDSNYDAIVSLCAHCLADTVTEVKGMPCQRCFHAVAMRDDDWCYTCAVAETLDDVSVVPRIQRMREQEAALPSTSETFAGFVREYTLAQGGRP